MKELMIKTLNDVYNTLVKKVVKKQYKYNKITCYSGISIARLQQLIAERNIPDYAEINFTYNYGDDEDMYIHWEEDNNNLEYRISYIKTNFVHAALNAMTIALLNNGYKSTCCLCNIQNEFVVYNWYMEKNWDKLEKYYSLFFEKDNINKSIT